MKSLIRTRLRSDDNLELLGIFKDICDEILIKYDNAKGYIKSYEKIEFLAPIYEGDYIEVYGEIVSFDMISRKIQVEVKKVISNMNNKPDYLYQHITVCKGTINCIANENSL